MGWLDRVLRRIGNATIFFKSSKVLGKEAFYVHLCLLSVYKSCDTNNRIDLGDIDTPNILLADVIALASISPNSLQNVLSIVEKYASSGIFNIVFIISNKSKMRALSMNLF